MSEWLDNVARTLASGASRRDILKQLGRGVAGVAVLSALPGTAEATEKDKRGNKACVEFCKQLPKRERGECVSQAAHGKGPCYECGPKAPHGTERELCNGKCCPTNFECRGNTSEHPNPCVCRAGFDISPEVCICPENHVACRGANQTECCPPGWFCKAAQEAACCPKREQVCGTRGSAFCCADGEYCCNGNSCCPVGATCCSGPSAGDSWCCPSGQVCGTERGTCA